VGKAIQPRQVIGQAFDKFRVSLGRIVDELISNPDQPGQFPSHISLEQTDLRQDLGNIREVPGRMELQGEDEVIRVSSSRL